MTSVHQRHSLLVTHPELADEWHPSRNSPLLPSDVSAGTNKKIWWLGKCGHEWQAVGASRSKLGTGCPYCSNQKVLAGFNDFSTARPDLVTEWHPTLNGALRPEEFLPGASVKIWWFGKCGHSWEATLNSRHSQGSGCPYCSNQKVLAGFNDLASCFPEVASEWNSKRNNEVSPTEVIKGSNKKYWWKCVDGHEWEAAVSSRTSRKTGCPFCSGVKVRVGVNDFATKHPALVNEWHPTKNGELKPQELFSSSDKKIWWLGNCGHEWESVLSSRTTGGTGCPVCAGKIVLEGFNDLATVQPELARQWHPSKNGDLLPTQVVKGTRKKAWWVCSNGHEWQAIIANRVWGNGCPFCTHQWVLPGENDLATISPELALQWHPTKNGDLTPGSIFATTAKKVWWICEFGHEWDARVSNRRSLGLGCPVCSNQRLLTGFNDLATTNPALAMEWHPTKNGELSPSDIFPNSEIKPWWLGKCGHEWQSDVGSRTRGNGCPYCSNQQILTGFNDLATTNPKLAKEWHPTKNNILTPSTVAAGTNKKIWWIGECGHEWEAIGASRSISGTGCPICSNHKLLVGFNDLQTLGSEILSEWHPTKNQGIDPALIVGSSSKKYWWRCREGHEWLASSGARLRGTRCPSCSVTGYNTVNPGTFYFIESNSLNARKVGIANQSSSRLENWLALGWELIHKVDSENGLHILNLETLMLRWIRKDLGLPPYLGRPEMGRAGGWSETFTCDGVTNFEVIQKIKALDIELQDLDE